jgi:sulfite exporter TauE/SafE
VEYLRGLSKFFTVNRVFFPLTLGLLTGLNLCPPFLLAFTSAVLEGNLWGSLVFFSAFFLGTSLYFVPIPLLGLVKRNGVVRNIGKMAAGVIGAYYLYLGIIILLGGIEKL